MRFLAESKEESQERPSSVYLFGHILEEICQTTREETRSPWQLGRQKAQLDACQKSRTKQSQLSCETKNDDPTELSIHWISIETSRSLRSSNIVSTTQSRKHLFGSEIYLLSHSSAIERCNNNNKEQLDRQKRKQGLWEPSPSQTQRYIIGQDMKCIAQHTHSRQCLHYCLISLISLHCSCLYDYDSKISAA